MAGRAGNYKRVFRGAFTLSLYSEGKWTPVGPGGGGWISAITVVEEPLHTLYVGCDVVGVYKSIDNGQSWEIKNNGLSIYFVQDIACDPVNHNILYAGVGVHKRGYDFTSYHWDSVEVKGSVYKSLDKGETWTLIRNTGINKDAMIYSLDIDPENPDNIYAAIEKGVYKSTDAGKTWKQKKFGLPKLKAMKML